MCRTLVTIVLGGALGASFSVSAHTVAPGLPIHPAAAVTAPRGSECQAADQAFKSATVLTPALNPVPGQIVPLAYRGTDRLVSAAAQRSAASPPEGGSNSAWRSTTAVLSTLALIGTIALRRYRAGKP